MRWSQLIPTIAWLLTTQTIVGNGLVIYFIVITKHLQTSTNGTNSGFVPSLAATDFFFALCFFPAAPRHIFLSRKLSRVTTSFKKSCRGSLHLSPSRTIQVRVTAADRYIAIVIPFIRTLRSWPFGLTIFFCSIFQTYVCTSSARPRSRIPNFNILQVINGVLFSILPCVFLVCNAANLAHIDEKR